eukprot:403350199
MGCKCKKLQCNKKCTITSLLIISDIGLFAILVLGIVVGAILYQSELLQAVEVNQMALGGGLGLAALCLLFMLFTVCLFCRKYKWLAGVYGTLMLIAFLIFLAFAIGLLYGKSNIIFLIITIIYSAYAKEFVDEQCRAKAYNQTDLQKIDYLYDTANLDLCKASCLCKANNNDWPLIQRPLVLTSANGVQNFPQCSSARLVDYTFWGTEWNVNKTKGFRALKAVENQFECASMCKTSYLYTFSDVSKGLPYRNCTTGVKDYIDKNFPIWAGMFLWFACAILCGLVASFIMCCCYRENEGKSLVSIKFKM